MTIPASEPDKIIAGGNGVATSFSFSPMTIFASSDLQVTHVGIDGTETLLSEGTGPTNYTVVVASYPGTGSITYPSTGATRLQTDEDLVMKAVLPFEQQLQLKNQGGYFPELLEQALDKQTKLNIQLAETIDRTLRLPIGSDEDEVDVELPNPEANKLLGWNATGDGLANFTALEGAVPVSSFMETVLDDTTAAAARATLGVTEVVPATTADAGIVELATDTEVLAGSDTARATVPASLLATMQKERGRIHNLRLVVSAAANAITIAVKTAALTDPSTTDPIRMPFRRTTLTSSDDIERTLTSALSLVVSSGSTLGLLANQQRRFYVVAIDNAGDIKLGVYNPIHAPSTLIVHHLALDEAQLYTTVAEGGAGGADLAHIIYSDSVYTTKAIRVLGYFEIQTGATPGEWGNQPTVVQLLNPGVPRSGTAIQAPIVFDGELASGATTIPNDDTPPLSGEGDQYLVRIIPVTSAVNILEIDALWHGDNSGTSGHIGIALFKDSDSTSLRAVQAGRVGSASAAAQGVLFHRMMAGAAGNITFKLRAGAGAAGTTRFNGSSGPIRIYGGVMGSFLRVTEIFA